MKKAYWIEDSESIHKLLASTDGITPAEHLNREKVEEILHKHNLEVAMRKGECYLEQIDSETTDKIAELVVDDADYFQMKAECTLQAKRIKELEKLYYGSSRLYNEEKAKLDRYEKALREIASKYTNGEMPYTIAQNALKMNTSEPKCSELDAAIKIIHECKYTEKLWNEYLDKGKI